MTEWLGTLWHFPFIAEIWGTAAEWFGAVGTVGSIALAVYFYRSKQLQEQRAQALHIVFSEANDYSDTLKLIVSNFSDESIFDIAVGITYEHTFRKALENECRRRAVEVFFDPDADQVAPLPPDDLASLRDEWENQRRIGSEIINHPFKEGRLAAGETKDFDLHAPYNFAARYWLQFRDSMARKWEYTLGNPEPAQLAWEPCKWWHIFIHPRCYLEQRKKRKDFNAWLDRNSAPARASERPAVKPQKGDETPGQS